MSFVVSPLHGVGSRGRLVNVVCPLVHPEKGPRGRLVFLYVVCLLAGVLRGTPAEDLSVFV